MTFERTAERKFGVGRDFESVIPDSLGSFSDLGMDL